MNSNSHTQSATQNPSRRDFLRYCAALPLASLFQSGLSSLFVQETDPTAAFLAEHEVLHGDESRKVILMSYDDVFTTERLGRILDVYKEFGAKCSFFIIGEDLEKCKGDLPRLLAEGHDLGCHGYTHSLMTMKSSRNLEQEFERYIARLDEYVPGFKLRYFRAPYGSRNDFVRETAAQFSLQHVLWTIESGGNDRQTIHNVLDRVQAGSIVLSHAHRKFDYREADTFVRELMRRGYQLENLTTGRSPADIYPGSSITTREPSPDLVQYRG